MEEVFLRMRIVDGGNTVTAHDPILDARRAAEYLNVDTRWIYDHIENDYLPCYRLGQMVRFRLSSLDDWLDSHRAGIAIGNHDGSPLLTSDEVARLLSVSRSWIYEARRSKYLPHYKLDGLLRFSRPLVDAWLEDRAASE